MCVCVSILCACVQCCPYAHNLVLPRHNLSSHHGWVRVSNETCHGFLFSSRARTRFPIPGKRRQHFRTKLRGWGEDKHRVGSVSPAAHQLAVVVPGMCVASLISWLDGVVLPRSRADRWLRHSAQGAMFERSSSRLLLLVVDRGRLVVEQSMLSRGRKRHCDFCFSPRSKFPTGEQRWLRDA